jgi:hypothetical protein
MNMKQMMIWQSHPRATAGRHGRRKRQPRSEVGAVALPHADGETKALAGGVLAR